MSIFTLLAQRHGWGPDVVGGLTRFQASAYLLGYGANEAPPMSPEQAKAWIMEQLKGKK